MALLLVMAETRIRPDLSTERATRGLYAYGDLVDVYEDRQHDGDLDRNPIAGPFVLFRVSDATKADVQRYIESETEERVVNSRVERVTVRRRQFRVRLSDLPARMRQELTERRYLDTTLADLRPYLFDKATGRNESARADR